VFGMAPGVVVSVFLETVLVIMCRGHRIFTTEAQSLCQNFNGFSVPLW
jgi:hypothetical protein